MAEISRKQLAEAKKKIEAEITLEKENAKTLLKELKAVSQKVASGARAYQSARDAYDKKKSDKNERKLTEANGAYKAVSEDYHRNKASLDKSIDSINAKYQSVLDLAISAGNEKIAERTSKDQAECAVWFTEAVAKADKSEGLAIPAPAPAPAPAPKEPEVQPEAKAAREPEVQPVAQPAKASVTSVNVAPVSIDVTPMIEKAISSAMEKLNDTMSKKIEAYVASLKLPEQTAAPVAAPAAQPVSGESVDKAGEIADTVAQLIEAEEHIIEKLKTMCTSVAEMLERLSTISEGYHNIAIKEKQLAELGKQINDMQRRTARDQQGVQVNQKLVTDEQLGIVAAQKLVIENQKELATLQKDISGIEAEILAGQKEILPDVKKILREQKQAMKRAENKEEESAASSPAEA